MFSQDTFMYGASLYGEWMPREQWDKVLDTFAEAHMNCFRVADSCWGVLEPAPGEYRFEWLIDLLDALHTRDMQAIMGAPTYIAPQWLLAGDPEMRVQPMPGVRQHPMHRKAACLNNGRYREACSRLLTTMAHAFKDHPAIVGWQLDNEINVVLRPCYCSACEAAWVAWLAQEYGSVEQLNDRLELKAWGLEVHAFSDIPLPTVPSIEGSRLLALELAQLHFRRDTINQFLADGSHTLRAHGVKQWLIHDWTPAGQTLIDEPRLQNVLDVSGLNHYPLVRDDPEMWSRIATLCTLSRSSHAHHRFIITESRAGAAGDSKAVDIYPSRERFRMMQLHPVIFGASGLLYWSSIRWPAGHWPHWGGVLDWSGDPEPDFAWVCELGALFKQWSATLLEHPVHATVAVVTDFDQRAALEIYPHTPASVRQMWSTFDVFHRIGVGVDTISPTTARNADMLSRYKLVMLSCAPCLDDPTIVEALLTYVEQGGHLLVAPFVSYQNWDGMFRTDGLGSNLRALTGCTVNTIRRMGTANDPNADPPCVKWTDPDSDSTSPIGIDGWCEILHVQPGVEVIATFKSSQAILDGLPAALIHHVGHGSVVKLGFWPDDASLCTLVQALIPDPLRMLRASLPSGAQAVPRTDGSMFLLNTNHASITVMLAEGLRDRLSTREVQGETIMEGSNVLWLERLP